MGSSPNTAYKGSLLSEEQKEAAQRRQNDFRHLLSAMQFPQERQNIFVNRRSARIHYVSQKVKTGMTLSVIKCPYCRSSLALDHIGVHFQKFCSGKGANQEASVKKYNPFYTHLQSHSRGEITTEELQKETDKLFCLSNDAGYESVRLLPRRMTLLNRKYSLCLKSAAIRPQISKFGSSCSRRLPIDL